MSKFHQILRKQAMNEMSMKRFDSDQRKDFAFDSWKIPLHLKKKSVALIGYFHKMNYPPLIENDSGLIKSNLIWSNLSWLLSVDNQLVLKLTLQSEGWHAIKPKHCPVGWGCWIHWLHRCRRVRPPPMRVLDMTLNNLMVRFQLYCSFGECIRDRPTKNVSMCFLGSLLSSLTWFTEIPSIYLSPPVPNSSLHNPSHFGATAKKCFLAKVFHCKESHFLFPKTFIQPFVFSLCFFFVVSSQTCILICWEPANMTWGQMIVRQEMHAPVLPQKVQILLISLKKVWL